VPSLAHSSFIHMVTDSITKLSCMSKFKSLVLSVIVVSASGVC